MTVATAVPSTATLVNAAAQTSASSDDSDDEDDEDDSDLPYCDEL